MKLLKVGLCLMLLLLGNACSANDGNKQILVMGTINDEDYQFPTKNGILKAKVLFYPQETKMRELTLLMEDVETKEVILKKVVEGNILKEENLCQIKTENIEGKFVIELGINDIYEKLEMPQECAYMFVRSYNATQNGEGAFDLLQFLEYRTSAPCEIDLISLHVYQIDKQYMVKLLVS